MAQIDVERRQRRGGQVHHLVTVTQPGQPAIVYDVPGASAPKVVAGSAGLTINGLPATLYPTVPAEKWVAGQRSGPPAAHDPQPVEAPQGREEQQAAGSTLAAHALLATLVASIAAFALWRLRAMRG